MKQDNSLHVTSLDEGSPPTISIRLFGDLEVKVDGVEKEIPGRTVGKWFLAYLALRFDEGALDRREVGQSFWKDKSADDVAGSLRVCLTHIRSSLKPADPFTKSKQDHRVSLNMDVIAIDLQSFDLAYAESRFKQVEELYVGPLLNGIEKGDLPKPVLENILPLIKEKRESSKQKYMEALTQLREAAAAEGDHVTELKYIDKAIATEPLVAAHYHLRMEKLYEHGELLEILGTHEKMKKHEVKASVETDSLLKRVRAAYDEKSTTKTPKAEPLPSEKEQFNDALNNDVVLGDQRDKAETTASDDIRKALLQDISEDIRVTELPLFGEGAARYNLFQNITLAPESLPIAPEASDSSGEVDNTVVSLLNTLCKKDKAEVWHLPLVAPPGAGKTTLLRWLTLQAAEQVDYLKRAGMSLIPAYIALQNLEEDAAEYLAAQHKTGPSAEIWRQWLNEGDCLFLLDGLELVSHAQVVRALLAKHPKCSSILTCRTFMPTRVESALTNVKHEPYRVLDSLSEEQQKSYIALYPNLTEPVRQTLQNLIQDRTDLRIQCSNPFVLSLLCYTMKHNEIPAGDNLSRSVLYNLAILTALQEQPLDKGRLAIFQKNPVHGEKMREALAHATLYTVCEMLAELSHLDKQSAPIAGRQNVLQKANTGFAASEIFTKGLEDWQRISGAVCEVRGSLLNDIYANSHLVFGDSKGVFANKAVFPHRILQEYLLASGLADTAMRVAKTCAESQADVPEEVVADAGWNAVRQYVNALSWLPEFDETLILLMGVLLERRQDAILTRLLRLLSDKDEQDTFRYRLALSAASFGQLTGKPITPELADCLRDISKQIIAAGKEVVHDTYLERQLTKERNFPFWLESHPVGRAFNALGNAYRFKKKTNRVAIPIGLADPAGDDPAGLNEAFTEISTEAGALYGFRALLQDQTGSQISDTRPQLIQQSWLLTLLGPALALSPMRENLIAWADAFQEDLDFNWTCIAHPIGVALRYGSEKDADHWFAWIQRMLSDYPEAVVRTLAPVFSQASVSLRHKIIELILPLLKKTPAYVTRKRGQHGEHFQDYIAFVLSYLLHGEVPKPLRQKVRQAVMAVPHASGGLCLLQMGLPENVSEFLPRWRSESITDGRQKYFVALRLWAGDISFEEALPRIQGTFENSVFEVPYFVKALKEEHIRILLSRMVKDDVLMLDGDTSTFSNDEMIGVIARSGTTEIRGWLREEILFQLRERRDQKRTDVSQRSSEKANDFLWRVLLQLGEDAVSVEALPEYAYDVASLSTTNILIRQRLISLSGPLARNYPSVRSELEQYVEDVLPDEFHDLYRQRKIKGLDNKLAETERALESDEWKGPMGILTRIVIKIIKKSQINSQISLKDQPATSLYLPGQEHLQYAAAVALSEGGMEFFSERIRDLIKNSYRASVGIVSPNSPWGVTIERHYADSQHPWLSWIQAGVRVFPKRRGETEVLLTIELAAQAFRKTAR